jgi:threonyl-tRNA synthetase
MPSLASGLIACTAWPTKDELRAYQARLEEAAKRDHRKLGVELDLFSFPDEIGSGLAIFHPKGGIIRREMEDYSRRRHEAAGYDFVYTPHITKASLFETSGHLGWYKDGMFPAMKLDEARNDEGEVTRQGADYYCSSSARSTATRSPASSTASRASAA